MPQSAPSRRRFLEVSAGAIATAAFTPYFSTADEEVRTRPRSKTDRLHIGAIGMRYQGTVVAKKALAFGDVVAICDVDRQVAEKARQEFGGKADLYENYRRMLERSDIDVVTIGTPDHWHTAMVVDACLAGKDIYCEKPLTLTIDEGKRLTETVTRTGRVVQVGSWQRSDNRFRLACELVHQGRIGKLQRVDVVLGPNVKGGPFAATDSPAHLNWDLWQGQTPAVSYVKQRCHYTFRWWYEYSGGQMTDWGAHHLDIAQWAIGAERSGPTRVEGEATFPDVVGGYNVALNYRARYEYPNGVELTVSDTGRNGIMFTGAEGRVFVNRGTLAGKPVEDLASNPLPRDQYTLYAHDSLKRPARMGKLDSIINHMGNFYDCLLNRKLPVSDVFSQHRSVTVCHLGNISMHLGRPLTWDPEQEQFVDDDQANRLLSRQPREGYAWRA